MPDMKTELNKVISGWENGTPSAPSSSTVSQRTFKYIQDNPGCTVNAAIAALEKMGLKPSSTTSLISAMVRQLSVRKDEHKRLYPISLAYVPLKQNGVKKPKPKPKAVPQAPAQGIAALQVLPKTFDAAALIDTLTLRQALEVRALLNKMCEGI
jgi:uncharacterized protein YneF (UPF0154 family)